MEEILEKWKIFQNILNTQYNRIKELESVVDTLGIINDIHSYSQFFLNASSSLFEYIIRNYHLIYDPFIICSMNIEALSIQKLDSIMSRMVAENIGVFCLQDTRTNATYKKILWKHVKANPKYKGFKIYFKLINKSKAAGVAFIVNKGVKANWIKIPKSSQVDERIAILEIILGQKIYRVINVYYPPSDKQEEILMRKELNTMVQAIQVEAHIQQVEFIIIGDFNAVTKSIHRESNTMYLRDKTHAEFIAKTVYRELISANLVENKNLFTRSRNDTYSVIDNMYCSPKGRISAGFIWAFP